MHEPRNFEHIFVGMDNADLADGAIATALHLGPVLGADVRILHAVNPRGMGSWMHEDRDAAQVLADLLDRTREDRYAHLRVIEHSEGVARIPEDQLSVSFGRPADVLVDATRESDHPLVVLGPHRRGRMFDFGGTTREVLSAATCPVLVQPGEWAPVRRILAAVDLSKGSEEILAVAVRLAGLLSAELSCMHAFQAPMVAQEGMYPAEIVDRERNRSVERFQELLERAIPASVSYERVVLEGFPAKAILRQQDRCDLLVMGSHGQSMFRRVMLGSESHRVLKNAARPVLVIPQRAIPHQADE